MAYQVFLSAHIPLIENGMGEDLCNFCIRAVNTLCTIRDCLTSFVFKQHVFVVHSRYVRFRRRSHYVC